jgi:hypothetical protein
MMKKLVGFAILVGFGVAFFLPATGSVSGEDEKIEFIGATKCKMCHNLAKTGKFFDDWMNNKHAKAFDLLKGDEQKDPKCQKCHTTGFGEPGGFQKFDDEASMKMVNVQCEMCHGPGGLHSKSKKDNVIPHAWEPVKETCEKCHNPESPTWKEDRYTDENGNKAGFIFEIAVKEVNHAKVKEALKK